MPELGDGSPTMTVLHVDPQLMIRTPKNFHVPGLDVLQKPLEGRPLHRPAGEASVVIHVGKRDPAGMTLAHDIGLARLPLGVERIEFLLEALVGRLAGVDRAADNLIGGISGIPDPCYTTVVPNGSSQTRTAQRDDVPSRR